MDPYGSQKGFLSRRDAKRKRRKTERVKIKMHREGTI